jgi:dephospho-CoA kinase
MLVGITGKMGSGKSTVAVLFEEWGARIISADRIGWRILEEPDVKRALESEFGAAIVDSEGLIDRKVLAKKAFASRDRLEALNSITHPALLSRLRHEMESATREFDMVVIDAALIAEWGIGEWFDEVIVVVCPEELKLERMTRSGMNRGDARKRLEHQMPDDERVNIASFVIDNSGSLEELSVKAREVFESIVAMQPNTPEER